MKYFDRILSTIAILISIITLFIANNSNGIAEESNQKSDKANILANEANEIAKGGNKLTEKQNINMDKTLNKSYIDIISKINSDLGGLEAMIEYDKPYFERKLSKEKILPLMFTLQQIYVYYKDGYLNKKQIDDNFGKYIDFGCNNAKDILNNFYSDYPQFSNLCSEL